MLIVGLTGSIGMGKSTVAAQFRAHGIAVFDADAAVHELYDNKAVPLIEAAFPGSTDGRKVDRHKLTLALAGDAARFAALEAIVHPLVLSAEKNFLLEEKNKGAWLAVLEVPLLLETGGDERVDAIVVVRAAPHQQRQRVLARPGMTEKKFDHIRSRQLDDDIKASRAEFVVDTGGTIAESHAQVDRIMAELKGRPARAYAAYWA